VSERSRLSLGRGTAAHVSRCISVQPPNSAVCGARTTRPIFFFRRRNWFRRRGYYLSEPMNAAAKVNAFASIRNALAALIGYPSNLEGCLSRRLQG